MANQKRKLNQLFERHLSRRRFFDHADKVIVAASTGADSTALLHLVDHLPPQWRPQIVVAHVNHELRAQSKDEEAFLRQYCRQHNLALRVTHWPKSTHPRTGVEAAARDFRYRFFAQVMDQTGARFVLTAHHADDQAETVLMKLTRGTGLSSVAGIRARRPFHHGWLIRPLLPFTRQQLREYDQQCGLRWFDDATNDQLTVSRNRYRHLILPALTRENAQANRHLAQFATELSDTLTVVNQAMTALTKTCLRDDQLWLPRWQLQDSATRRCFVRWWLERSGVLDLTAGQLDEMVTCLADRRTPNAEFSLPHGYQLIKNYHSAKLTNQHQNQNICHHSSPDVVELGRWYQLGNGNELAVLNANSPTLSSANESHEMWLAPSQFPLQLRQIANGDRLRLKGGHFQRVSRVLISAHVPAADRPGQWVLVDATGVVVWLVGQKLSWFDRQKNYQDKWRHVFLCRRQQKGELHE